MRELEDLEEWCNRLAYGLEMIGGAFTECAEAINRGFLDLKAKTEQENRSMSESPHFRTLKSDQSPV